MLDSLKELHVLEDGQWYIYVLENSDGYIKVGRTTNLYQRIKSLSGSNTGGSSITRCTYSPPTYLYTLESVIHSHFNDYRVEGEWFKDIAYEDVITYLRNIVTSKSYHTCNEVRKRFNETFKGKDVNINGEYKKNITMDK